MDQPLVERIPDSQAIPTAPHEQLHAHLSDAHFPALDGIRGIAILWVMLYHMTVFHPIASIDFAWADFCRMGALGVDIFFVLSGFLITGILSDTRETAGYFRNFYARRILRIFPLYYTVVAFSLLLLPMIPNPKTAKFGRVQGDAVFYWLHLSNFAIARRGQFVHGILDVSWSLAIEEQFYLLWPAVILLVTPRRVVQVLCALLVTVSIVSRCILCYRLASPIAIYTLTFAHMDGLAVGAFLAIWIRNGGGRRAGRAPLAAAIVFLMLLAVTTHAKMLVVSAAFTFTLISLVTAAIMLGVVRGHAPSLSRVLAVQPLRFLGKLSYGLYLFHFPLMAVVRDAFFSPATMPNVLGSALPGQLLFYVFSIGISLTAALVSWHFFEKPILKLKRFFPKSLAA